LRCTRAAPAPALPVSVSVSVSPAGTDAPSSRARDFTRRAGALAPRGNRTAVFFSLRVTCVILPEKKKKKKKKKSEG
jgi:hypothetical protein